MKRYGNLWERIVRWENLILAARKASRSKRDRRAVQYFDHYLEFMLVKLQRELQEGTYTPGGFSTH